MIEYLYLHQYSDSKDCVVSAKMYGLATKYEIKSQRLAVIENYRSSGDRENLAKSVPLIYSNTIDTDRGLRDRIMSRINDGYVGDKLLWFTEMGNYVREYPGFASDIGESTKNSWRASQREGPRLCSHCLGAYQSTCVACHEEKLMCFGAQTDEGDKCRSCRWREEDQ